MNWKKTHDEIRELVGKAGGYIYDASVKIKALLEDKDYQKDCDNNMFEMHDRLNRLLGIIRLNTTELLQLLKRYPNRADWCTKNLDTLYREMLVEINKERAAARPSKSKRPQPVKVAPLPEWNATSASNGASGKNPTTPTKTPSAPYQKPLIPDAVPTQQEESVTAELLRLRKENKALLKEVTALKVERDQLLRKIKKYQNRLDKVQCLSTT